MVVKLKHAFTYETNICFIECCLQKLEFSEKYQAELIDFSLVLCCSSYPSPCPFVPPQFQ